MKVVLPLVLAAAGAAAGVGAGLFLKPETHGEQSEAVSLNDENGTPAIEVPSSGEKKSGNEHQSGSVEYVKLNNQFVVPVLSAGKVKSMVVISLTVEAPLGSREQIYAREPRIRDEFLQVMFNHANMGGFDGTFTTTTNLDALRTALRETGNHLLGGIVQDILVTDIARQDL